MDRHGPVSGSADTVMAMACAPLEWWLRAAPLSSTWRGIGHTTWGGGSIGTGAACAYPDRKASPSIRVLFVGPSASCGRLGDRAPSAFTAEIRDSQLLRESTRWSGRLERRRWQMGRLCRCASRPVPAASSPGARMGEQVRAPRSGRGHVGLFRGRWRGARSPCRSHPAREVNPGAVPRSGAAFATDQAGLSGERPQRAGTSRR